MRCIIMIYYMLIVTKMLIKFTAQTFNFSQYIFDEVNHFRNIIIYHSPADLPTKFIEIFRKNSPFYWSWILRKMYVNNCYSYTFTLISAGFAFGSSIFFGNWFKHHFISLLIRSMCIDLTWMAWMEMDGEEKKNSNNKFISSNETLFADDGA